MEIEIRAGEGGAATVIAAHGELDVLTAASLRTAVGDVIDGGRAHLVLDASGITFMDSTGIGVLVIALRRTRALDGSFAIAGVQGRALRTFEMTGLARVFTLYDTVEDAQAALAPLAGEPR
jgi:anti-sigma B factor antagonist